MSYRLNRETLVRKYKNAVKARKRISQDASDLRAVVRAVRVENQDLRDTIAKLNNQLAVYRERDVEEVLWWERILQKVAERATSSGGSSSRTSTTKR